MPNRDLQQQSVQQADVSSVRREQPARRETDEQPEVSQQTRLQRDAIARAENPSAVAGARDVARGGVAGNAAGRDSEYFVSHAFAVDGVFYTRENARDVALLDDEVIKRHIDAGNIVRNPARVETQNETL